MDLKKKRSHSQSKKKYKPGRNVHSTSEDKEKKTPKTIENSKAPDATALANTSPDELSVAFNNDEFASFFNQEVRPNVIITTVRRAHRKTLAFATEFADIFGGTGGASSQSSENITLPPARMIPRKGCHSIDVVIQESISNSCTDIIVIGERMKEPYSLTIIHLPNGPTAYFRLSSIIPSKELSGVRGSATPHPLELNMANFDTMLGMTVGRFLTSLFPHKPQFEGRQVVTFHNQRDYIFFRRHRYIFTGVDGGETPSKPSTVPSVRMQELGPRFTLKLMALQQGVFNPTTGNYIWIRSNSKMNTRTKFYC